MILLPHIGVRLFGFGNVEANVNCLNADPNTQKVFVHYGWFVCLGIIETSGRGGDR